MEQENTQLLSLLKEEYEDWCLATGNPGAVRLAELESAAALMGDLHSGGKLLLPRPQAQRVVWQLLDDLNEKSLYVQSRSFLPAVTKGLPGWAKWVVLAVGVAALACLALFAESVAARTPPGEEAGSAVVYHIA